MNDKPIIMGAESVRAILAGRKTVTRRLLSKSDMATAALAAALCGGSIEDAILSPEFQARAGRYHVGDRLWVREAWAIGVYRADVSRSAQSFDPPFGRWRSPIFMPRGFSRIDLEVVSRRAEGLQEITEADAEREGCREIDTIAAGGQASARAVYLQAWDRLNPKAPAASNPWVWRIEFRVVEIRGAA